MKKIYTILVMLAFVFIGLSAMAQSSLLYGFVEKGGPNGYGSLFSFNDNSNTLNTIINFNGINGAYPDGNLIQAYNGKIYGLISSTNSAYGVLVEFNPVTNSLTTLINFNGPNGKNPQGSLLQATDGMLYGLTHFGGSSNSGTLFKFNPSTGILTTEINFAVNNGQFPYGSLIQASNGKLYGLTAMGGSSQLGNLFEFNPVTGVLISDYTFIGANGSYPYGSLLQGSNGLLYGYTCYGGTYNDGTLFKFNPANDSLTTVINFDNTNNGIRPYASLMLATNGMMYGMTGNGAQYNHGTLFQFNPSNDSLFTIINFDSINGSNPEGSLMQIIDGRIYGMTTYGGNSNDGTLFEFNPATNILTTIIQFNSNGSNPRYSTLLETFNCSANFLLYPDTSIAHHYWINNNAFGTGTLHYDWSWGDTTQHDTIPYPSHVYADSGFYNICLTITDSLGCTSTSCDSSFHIMRTANTVYWVDVINPNFTTGIKNNKTNSLSIFPNPASTLLNIHHSTCTSQETLLITDLLGNEVYKEMLTGIDNSISISTWSAGIYFYEVRGSGLQIPTSVRGKFVKEN